MSSDESIYSPPGSPIERPSAPYGGGTLGGGLNGDYKIELGEIFSEAWALTAGSKRVILGGMLLSYAVAFGTQIAGAIVLRLVADGGSPLQLALGMLMQLGGGLLAYPISAGVMLYAARRAAGAPDASFADVTGTLSRIGPILGLALLQGLLTMIGFALFVIPGIYLAVAYMLSTQLMVDREMGIWECLETSRTALTHQWFQFALFGIATMLIVVLGALLTLGIGLIWLVPFSFLSIGIVYREVFGVQSAGG